MNKYASKRSVAERGVRVSPDVRFSDPKSINLNEVFKELGADVILKPTDQGSSVSNFCN